MRESSNKSKSYADALKSHHVDNSAAIDTKPSNIGKQKIELRAQNQIAEKKSNPGKLNSEKLRKIYINFMEDEREQSSLILDSKTTLGFRENVASEIVSTPLLNSVIASGISDYSIPAQGDTSAESFDNYDHEMLCLLQSLPMDKSTQEQTDISVDTLIDRNVKNQPVFGIGFNDSINFRNISTKRISSVGVTITDEGRLKRTFCSETAFNLSHKVFNNTEIKVLEQRLDFAPTHKCINKPELRKDFVEFCKKMRINGIFVMKLRKTLVQPPCFVLNLTGHPL